MQRTSASTIFKLKLVSFVIAFGFAKFFATTSNGLLPVNLGSPISLAVLDTAMFIWVLTISDRLPKVEKSGTELKIVAAKNPLPPLVAARTVAFALSGSRVGSFIFGAYLGLGFSAWSKRSVVAYAENANYSFSSAFFGLVMIVISIWLERKCSPPKPISN